MHFSSTFPLSWWWSCEAQRAKMETNLRRVSSLDEMQSTRTSSKWRRTVPQKSTHMCFFLRLSVLLLYLLQKAPSSTFTHRGTGGSPSCPIIPLPPSLPRGCLLQNYNAKHKWPFILKEVCFSGSNHVIKNLRKPESFIWSFFSLSQKKKKIHDGGHTYTYICICTCVCLNIWIKKLKNKTAFPIISLF